MRNIDVDSNAKDPYVNDVNHNNCENYVVTGFSRQNYSPEVRHIKRPIWLQCTRLSLSYGYWLTGCPEGWKAHNHSCYYWTGETSSTLNDAEDKCKKMSANLPINKSDSANTFICTLGRYWAWLGMKRENGKMVWFDNTPAEPFEGALYSKWRIGEPSNVKNQDWVFLVIGTGEWSDDQCDHGGSVGPYVLCQK